jgi:CHAT domain-containing protein
VQRQVVAKQVAVLADPVFSRDDARVLVQSAAIKETGRVPAAHQNLLRALNDLTAGRTFDEAQTWRIPRLPGTRAEADQIAALVPGAASLRAVDFAASRTLATSEELSRYRIVHFATHALINTTHPELSGIVLSLVDEQGRPQDGFLPAHEIYNLKLSAELVVLSACQTGLGKELRGEGLVGMTQSFFYAGAPRVMVSLWAQQDRATAVLMSRFYQRLLNRPKFPQSLTPAAALRAAQLEMWRSGRWPSPYFWAGFTLQGEWK